MINKIISVDLSNIIGSITIIEAESKTDKKYQYTILSSKQFNSFVEIIDRSNKLLLEYEDSLFVAYCSKEGYDFFVGKFIKKPIFIPTQDINIFFLNNKLLQEEGRFCIANFTDGETLINELLVADIENIESVGSLYKSVSVGLWYGETILTKKKSNFYNYFNKTKSKEEKEKQDESFDLVNIIRGRDATYISNGGDVRI